GVHPDAGQVNELVAKLGRLGVPGQSHAFARIIQIFLLLRGHPRTPRAAACNDATAVKHRGASMSVASATQSAKYHPGSDHQVGTQKAYRQLGRAIPARRGWCVIGPLFQTNTRMAPTKITPRENRDAKNAAAQS